MSQGILSCSCINSLYNHTYCMKLNLGVSYKTHLNYLYLAHKMPMRSIAFSPLITRSRPLFITLVLPDVYNLDELVVHVLTCICDV